MANLVKMLTLSYSILVKGVCLKLKEIGVGGGVEWNNDIFSS